MRKKKRPIPVEYALEQANARIDLLRSFIMADMRKIPTLRMDEAIHVFSEFVRVMSQQRDDILSRATGPTEDAVHAVSQSVVDDGPTPPTTMSVI